MVNKLYLRLMMVTICLPFITAPVTATEKLSFLTGEWLPYTSDRLERGGVLVELVRSVVSEMDMHAEFTFYPWKRAERLAENGIAFAAFPYGKTDYRLSRFRFSDNLFSTPTVFFYRRNSLPITEYGRFEDLRSFRIGGNHGYNYVRWFKSAGLDLVLAESQEQLIKMLGKKRVDLIAIDPGAGWMMIDKLFPGRRDQFAIMKRPIERNAGELGSHLMVSPDYPNHSELISRFNRALRRIRKNGTYASIIKMYNMEGGALAIGKSEN